MFKQLMRHVFLLACVFWSSQAFTDTQKKHVLFITGAHSNTTKINLLKERSQVWLKVHRETAASLASLTLAENTFRQYDLIVFDGVSARETKQTHGQFEPLVKKVNKKFLAIKWLEGTSLRRGITVEQAKLMGEYYDNGGHDNMERLAQFIRFHVLDKAVVQVPPPIVFPTTGIYHPDYESLIFDTLNGYLSWSDFDASAQKNQPVIGILFQRAAIESATMDIIDSTITKFEAKGALVVPFYFELSPTSADYTPMLKINDKTFVDLIINFRSIHWANKRKSEFEALGVPVLQALTYYSGNQQQWEQDNQGITPGMSAFSLVLPESAGVVDPWVVAALNDQSERAEIIEYQHDHLIDKTLKVAALKHKRNVEKKITVMVWGSRDVGASFMNIPESLSSIAHRLSDEGYNIPKVQQNYFTDRIDRILNPFYRSYELAKLIKDDLAELLPHKEYLGWFNTLPKELQNEINRYWGKPEDNFMAIKRNGHYYFVIPRIRAGNMLVMRQPPRADNSEDDLKYYHTKTAPINHYYLAAYFYARKYWASDAIVHLGTHGSHEYLPGKERGLSLYDQGNLAVWDTPVVYPFIVDDVGEAMQTKRRGRATVVAHMTAPFAAAGLHNESSEIHELMHEYKSLDEGGVKKKTRNQIIDICLSANICSDLGMEKATIIQDFDGFLEIIHSYLEELAAQNQPLGLHTFGQLPEKRLMISTIIQILGKEFSEQVIKFESTSHGHSHDKHHRDYDEHVEQQMFHSSGESIEESLGYNFIERLVINGEKPPKLSKPLTEILAKAHTVFTNFSNIRELDSLVDFLSSNYIPVKNGGDVLRNPEVLPTGFNLYGFDPNRVPTKAAWEQGKELTDQLINDYYNTHGQYPDKLAFSLWSMETMRQYGVLEAQALYAMGVTPVWSEDGRVTGTEIIPASKLKRPRVDVVLSATGLYRDAFPNVMQWMAKSIRDVAELKEANNSVWDNAQKVKSELVAAGIDQDEAQYLSTVRIFSNESGNYGSGLGDATIASDSWETDAKLADLYLSRMSYFYGDDNSRWGKQAPQNINLFSRQLSGTDIALFSRSSNTFGMLSSDDPFQYFGGLALAVRNIDGQSPEMYISNLRDAKNPKSESAAKFMSKELRTRSFHPRWIEEMQKEGYSGAVTMASTVSNFFGWQVMDPNLVRDDQWQEFHDVYVNDKYKLGLNEWFEQVDPAAQARIIERILEASRKEYWQASEQTVKELISRYETLVNQFDLVVDNEKLREFVESQATGFGLNLSLPTAEAPATPVDIPAETPKQPGESAQATKAVEGQKLEQVEQASTHHRDLTLIYFALFISLIFFGLGVVRQMLTSSRTLNVHSN